MATTLLFPKTAGRGGEEAVAAFLKLLLHSCSSRSGFRRKPWAGCLKTPPGSPAMVRVQQWVGLVLFSIIIPTPDPNNLFDFVARKGPLLLSERMECHSQTSGFGSEKKE